jgi:excisionase family DNA binding protein
MTLLTTNDAAARLGLSARRVRMLIDEGRLPAVRVGRDWLIQERDLRLVAVRPNGRPRGTKG